MTATVLEPATAIEVALSEVRDRLRELADNASNEDLLDELSKLLRSARGKVNRAVRREREDDWLATHRFSYGTALRLAMELAPQLEVRGVKACDVLAAAKSSG